MQIIWQMTKNFSGEICLQKKLCVVQKPQSYKESFRKNKASDGHCYNSTCKGVSLIEAKTKQKTTHPELEEKSSIHVHQIGAETKNLICSSNLIKVIKQDFKNYQKF